MAEVKKTLSDRMLEEVLSDNTHEEPCKQCKDCKLKSDGTAWSNKYTKSCCQIFQYPAMKPLYVINNTGECRYKEK